LYHLGPTGELTDGQLLERFAAGSGETAELAFAALVDRHGPIVLRVCRAILRDEHDAQDAFQATFLILVSKARSLWVRDSLAPWLHQVAYRAAHCNRTRIVRRRVHERTVAEKAPAWVSTEVGGEDIGEILHQEIERLPERYRAPVVLCDLEDRTHEQAARHLGCPVGTVKSRLARGRERLRVRLTRRGLAPINDSLGEIAVAEPAPAALAVPAALAGSTVRAALGLEASQTAAGVVSDPVVVLVEEVLKVAFLAKIRIVSAVLLTLGIVGAGGFLTAYTRTHTTVGPGKNSPRATAPEPAFASRFSTQPAAMTSTLARESMLPPLDQWTKHDMNLAETTPGQATGLRLTAMFKPGGLVSPSVAARPGEGFTLSVMAETTYVSPSGYYFFWIELEFLDGDRVLHTFSSPQVRGPRPKQLLAVTGIAPPGTTAVRATLRAQNRIYRVLPNLAQVESVRLVRLNGQGSGPARLAPVSVWPKQSGPRETRVTVIADWPDGTAVTFTTTRGDITPSLVLAGGRGEAKLTYGEGDLGAASVTASVAGLASRLTLDDPYAARLTIPTIEADGVETPALVQLIRDGKVLPGRYERLPGEFVRAPGTLRLAPGRYTVRVSRGPQFETVERQVDLESGYESFLDPIALKRAVDLRPHGWYGGDPDGDVCRAERIYTDVTAETAGRVARAVGLDRVTPANWGEPEPKNWGEARSAMDELSSQDLLFRFADEKQWHTGHFSFVGLERPDNEAFGDYWNKIKRINPAEALHSLRNSGAATFVNHPVRFWMSSVDNDTFVTNMYASLPFDLCAAGLLDGININEGGEPALKLWSLLLDHGYRVTATGGADFSLDHPDGWLPGLTRLYVHAPAGLSEQAIVHAIKAGHTTVSTGPLLVANIDSPKPPGSVVPTGQTHRIYAHAWTRHDQIDRLRKIELYAHGRVVLSRDLHGLEDQALLEWTPSQEHDWVAVRLLADSGWAMTSAFYAAAPGWEPPKPVNGHVNVSVNGLKPHELHSASVEVWDNRPDAPAAKRIDSLPLDDHGHAQAHAPVTATIRLVLADGRHRDIRFYDASGVSAIADAISRGAEKDAPLLRWDTYDDILRRCRNVNVDFRF